MQTIVLIGTILVSLAIGVTFSCLPWQTKQYTDTQRRIEQVLGIGAVALVVLLIMADQDTASWVAIGAMAAGVAIGHIPMVRRPVSKWFPSLASTHSPTKQSVTGKSAKRHSAGSEFSDRHKDNHNSRPRKKSTSMHR